jgi:phage protein D
MAQISASIAIAGEPAPDLLPSVLELEVEEDHDMASVVRVKLAIYKPESGLWTFLDDDRLQLWSPITVSAKIADDEQELFAGFITEIKGHFDIEDNASYVVIQGMDATCLMALEEKIKDWPNMSDSDIATQILGTYNVTPQVEDTGVVHDDTIATIIQRETDFHFLKRLARRNGFESGVRGDQAYFRKPVLDSPPLPVLAVQFGGETNVAAVDTTVNALRAVQQVEMHRIDTIGKQAQDASITSSDQTTLGTNGVAALAPPGGAQPKVIVKHALATGIPEMQNLCQAVFDRAEWFVEAKGHVDSVAYGSFLRAQQVVPMKGAGEMFSGMYYLTNVRHVITVNGYLQHFTGRRNATAPTGSDFTSSGSLF